MTLLISVFKCTKIHVMFMLLFQGETGQPGPTGRRGSRGIAVSRIFYFTYITLRWNAVFFLMKCVFVCVMALTGFYWWAWSNWCCWLPWTSCKCPLKHSRHVHNMPVNKLDKCFDSFWLSFFPGSWWSAWSQRWNRWTRTEGRRRISWTTGDGW